MTACRLMDLSLVGLASNMALEEALLESAAVGRSGPVLRFWSNGPSVAVGLAQPLGQVVRLDRCLADKVPVIRRCSGGGAVYHDRGNLNFTLVIPAAGGLENVAASYRLICGSVVLALRSLGLTATLAAPSDVCVEGRKVSGNAQARRRGVLLHHGTLLLETGAREMERYLPIPEHVSYARHEDFVTNLRAVGCRASMETVKASLSRAFSNCFGLQFTLGSPSDEEFALSARFFALRYGKREWNYRR